MKRGRKACNRKKPVYVRVTKQNLLWFKAKCERDEKSRSLWLDEHFDKLRERDERTQLAG